MAKYTVNHTCGHTQTHELFGKGSKRESKLEWLETTECVECWKKSQEIKKQKEREQAQAEAQQFNNDNTLPELTGTDKQIEWANVIRLKFFNAILPLYNHCKTSDKEIDLFVVDTWDWLKSKTDAKFFIDNREPVKTPGVIDMFNMAVFGDSRAATNKEIAEHIFKLSPHLTLDTAKTIGIDDYYLAKQERAAAIKANPKPKRPDWYQAIFDSYDGDAYFNGKIYGSRIYVGGDEHSLTDAQVAELEEYQAKLRAYRKAVKGA